MEIYEAKFVTYDSGVEISLGIFFKKKRAKKAIKRKAKYLGVRNHTYSFEGWVERKQIE